MKDKRKGEEKENSLLCWLCALVHQRLQWECNHPESSFPLLAILTLLDSGGLGCDGTITLFPITFSHQNQGHLLKSSSKVLINNNKEMLLTCQALKREGKHFPNIISFCKPALWILLNSPLNISTGNEIQMDCLSISSCPTYISCVWSRSCHGVPYIPLQRYTSTEEPGHWSTFIQKRKDILVGFYPSQSRHILNSPGLGWGQLVEDNPAERKKIIENVQLSNIFCNTNKGSLIINTGLCWIR